MTDTAPAPSAPKWLAWMPAFSLVAILASALLTGGGYISKQDEQSRRIETLERKVEKIDEIDKRTIRIEARLEVLTPAEGKD